MDSLTIFVLVCGAIGITIGLFGLAATVMAPRLLDPPFMRWLFTGKLPPTRANRLLISVWSLLFGSYLFLSHSGHLTLGFIAFAAWLPFAFILLKRQFSRRKTTP